ncbi:hypothetical protein LTR84_006960 [Exophiala bonariae]|uniref:C2H2-type domain-containing protein n=1 Tax=Exophiala bonariae TaxID=1690606 RepID=A0AAV9MZU8_9EURO|nr:hypothetical protein LTR84_006960 [Exophiala bonariae]
MSRDMVSYNHEGSPLVPAPAYTTRPRIINQGHMNIDPNYNADIEIVNMPGSTINLTGAQPTPVSSESGPRKPPSSGLLPTPAIPTAIPQSTAVPRFYCLSCKAKYFTQEKLDEHVKGYPNYCSVCNACRKPDGRNYCCWSGGYRNFWRKGKGGAVR